MKAINKVGASGASNEVSAIPLPTPGGVNAKVTRTAVSLTWNCPAGGISAYEIQVYQYQKGKPGVPAIYMPIGTPIVTGSASRSYVVTGLPPGSYVFTVAAGNGTAFGPFSKYSNAITVH